MYSSPFSFPTFLLFKVLCTKVAQHTIRKDPHPICSSHIKYQPAFLFYINVPFIGHIYPIISTFLHAYMQNYLLLITCVNVIRKGRIYYWNIFGLSLCSVCQDNIGHRLLQKHGWKLGQGLGKSLQGKFLKFTKKKKKKCKSKQESKQCFLYLNVFVVFLRSVWVFPPCLSPCQNSLFFL